MKDYNPNPDKKSASANEPAASYSLDIEALRAESMNILLHVDNLNIMKQMASALKKLLPKSEAHSSTEELLEEIWALPESPYSADEQKAFIYENRKSFEIKNPYQV